MATWKSWMGCVDAMRVLRPTSRTMVPGQCPDDGSGPMDLKQVGHRPIGSSVGAENAKTVGAKEMKCFNVGGAVNQCKELPTPGVPQAHRLVGADPGNHETIGTE